MVRFSFLFISSAPLPYRCPPAPPPLLRAAPAPPVVAPPPRPRSSDRRASPLLAPPLLCAVAIIHPSLHPPVRPIAQSTVSWVTTRGRARSPWLNLQRRRRPALRRRLSVLPWPPRPPTIRPLVAGVGYRFASLEPGSRSSRVSESVHLPIGRFVNVRGLKEGTMSVRMWVRDSRRPGPVALAPLHRTVRRTVRS
jgi:hypothetical protein